MQYQGLLSVKELSSYLGVSPCTVYRWVENKDIPFIRRKGLGLRFRKEAIDEWLDKSSRKPAPNTCGPDFALTLPPKSGIKIRMEKQEVLARCRKASLRLAEVLAMEAFF